MGQFLRLCRICSEEGDFQQEKEEMCNKFCAQGYKTYVLCRAMNIAEVTPNIGKQCKPNLFDTLIFSTPYNMEFSKIRRIMERHILILIEDKCYAKIHTKGFKTMSRRAHSLANSLSPSDFNSSTHSRTWLDLIETFRCGATNCQCCPGFKTM